MKRIGIITILKCNNFGAELQAYANQKKLQQMGYDAEIIDYLYYKHPNFKYTRQAKPVWERSLKTDFFEYIKYQIVGKVLSVIGLLFVKKQRSLDRKFNDFHLKNTKLSKTYRSIEELYAAKMDYDVYMVGSDQVWNPGTGANLSPYFLTFAPKDAKKVSYASSFGVTYIPETLRNTYREWINNINNLSVREDAGCSIIKELTGRDSEVVLDPTLLLTKDDWADLYKGQKTERGYVLIYETYRSKKLLQMAYHYADKYHVSIFRIQTKAILNKKDKGIINLEDCGPEDFVRLIANAGLVLTGSFHGTAFSVNLGVPFYSILLRGRDNNSRITSLLRKLGLEDRIVYEDDSFERISWKTYDVANSQQLLQTERELSLKYIKDSIDA